MHMTGGQQADVDEMDREELAAEVEELRDELEFYSDRLDRLEELVLGEYDLTSAEMYAEEDGGMLDRLDALELGEANTDVSGGVSKAARDFALPIHQVWWDIRDGRDDSIDNDSVRRAAILFRELFRRASGEPRSAVNADQGTYKIASPDAKQPLVESEYLDLDLAHPQTVKRAFRAFQRLTKTESCDCDSIDECDHGIVIAKFDSGTNKLVADKAKFDAYCQNVERELERSGESTDDPGNAGEDADATDDATDDVVEDAEAELDAISNAVVSRDDGTALDQPAHTDGGETTR